MIEPLTVEVFYQVGDPAFIVAVNGRVLTDELVKLEAEIAAGAADLFKSGDGTYRCVASWEDSVYDEMGRCELLGGWGVCDDGVELIAPLPPPPDDAGPGEPEPIRCEGCGWTHASDVASCAYCGRRVCDSCYTGRHEHGACDNRPSDYRSGGGGENVADAQWDRINEEGRR